MSDFWSKTAKTILQPIAHRFDMGYLKLRCIWERYANHRKMQFSEHSLLDAMYMPIEEGLSDTVPEGYAMLKAINPKFMPVSRITYNSDGFTVGIQSLFDWAGSYSCQSRINLQGHQPFGIRIEKSPGLAMKACGVVRSLPIISEKVKAATDEARSRMPKDGRSEIQLQTVDIADASLVSRHSFSASSATRPLFDDEHFLLLLKKCTGLQHLFVYGNPNYSSSNRANQLFADFMTPYESTDQLDAIIDLFNYILRFLQTQQLISPPAGPDEVAS